MSAGAAHAFGLGQLGANFGSLGHLGGAQGPQLILSNSTVLDTAISGTTIGSFLVLGGVGSYTYTLTSNPGSLFSISGSSLQSAGALTAGSDPIIVKADNGAGSAITKPLIITVLHATGHELLAVAGIPILAQNNTPILVQ